MGSGLVIGVFSSWEVILTSLLLIFLLPLVFYVASSKSRPKRSVPQRAPKKRVVAKKAPATPGPEDEDDRVPGDRPRRAEPPDAKSDRE